MVQKFFKYKGIQLELLQDAEVETHVQIYLRILKFNLFSHNKHYYFSDLRLIKKIQIKFGCPSHKY
jgi:hypothetical protein